MRQITLIILSFCVTEFVLGQFPKSYRPNHSTTGIPYRIEMSYDSGWLVSGTEKYPVIDNGVIATKLDGNGGKLWSRTLVGKVYNRDLCFKQSLDGGYFVFGTTYENDPTGDAYLGKLNPCGELEWGVVFRLSEWNWINDVKELDNNRLLINQTGNSFRINGWLYSHVGIYSISQKQYTTQRLIAVEPGVKRTTYHNGWYYNIGTWTFRSKADSTIGILGTHLLAYNEDLTRFKIRSIAPESLTDTIPLFWSNPIFLAGGNVIAGGSLLGLRDNIAYPMSFVKFNQDLVPIQFKDMGHVSTPFCAESAEHLILSAPDRFIAVVNTEPNHDFPSTWNGQADVYLLDTNFNELKSVRYGDTVNFKHWTYDVAIDHNGNLMLLMHAFKNVNDIKYELVKFDKNLNLVSTGVSSKNYDYKCLKTIDSAYRINLSQFDTIIMKDWNQMAKNTEIKDVKHLECKIYPNPASDQINVQFNQAQNGTIKLFDGTGKLIKCLEFAEQNEIALNTVEWLDGLFFIRIETDTSSIVQAIRIGKFK